jgi:hypothetical protein
MRTLSRSRRQWREPSFCSSPRLATPSNPKSIISPKFFSSSQVLALLTAGRVPARCRSRSRSTCDRTEPFTRPRSIQRCSRGFAARCKTRERTTSWPSPPRWTRGAQRLVAEELTKSCFEPAKTLDWPISATVRHYSMLFLRPRLDDYSASLLCCPVRMRTTSEIGTMDILSSVPSPSRAAERITPIK